MKKDFKRKHYEGRGSSDRRPQFLLIGIVVVLGGLIGMTTYQYKKNPQRFAVLSECYNKMTHWVTERKQHLNQSINIAKQMAVKNTEEQPIHFEFYTALPNMKVAVGSDAVSEPALTKPVLKKPTPSVITTEPAVQTVAYRPSAFNAADLERQMSNEFKSTAYVVQLGVFRGADAAQKYREALIAAGFKAVVSKIKSSEKELYRVHIGPFVDKSQALLTQRQLQKKGMSTGIVRKTT